MQTENVAKGLIFKMRIDEADKARLDKLAEHYAAPGATVVRMILKEKYDQLEVQKSAMAAAQEDDFRWKEWHDEILGAVLNATEPMTRKEIAEEMPPGYMHSFWKAQFPRALNQLTSNGYLRRFKSGYVITEKGRAKTV